MTKLLKRLSYTVPVLAMLSPGSNAQAIPADTATAAPGVGFSLPRVGGSLSYGINASELMSNGFYNSSGVDFTTNISGDAAYVSKSQLHPFSAVYAGGVLVGNSGQPTTVFQNLSFSQVLSTKRWNIVLGDSISYLPESPALGLSGIPGVGDLGVDPVTTAIGGTPGLGILTTYGPRISNSTSGSLSRDLTGRLSATASGNYAIQRFIGDNSGQGTDTTTEGGSAGLNYKLSARDGFAVNYTYTSFTVSNTPFSFTTQGGTVGYSRQWTRRFSTNVYAGPQVTSGNDYPVLTGSSTSVAGGANANYLSRTTSYSLNYSRGVNNGSGVLPGAFSDNVSLAAHRQFGQLWALSGNVAYSRSTSLPVFTLFGFNSNSLAFGGQATRGFGRYLSAFASYTLQDQSVSGTGVGNLTPNAFNGLYQVFGIGVSYSPRNILLGR